MQLHYWDGKARASVWMATLVACLIMAAFVRYADAQESALSFKECLDKQKELRDESKSFGDRAWAAVGLLQGAKFFSEESNALYEKASELGKAADAVHCVMQLGSTPVTDAEKLKQFDDMDNILRDKAILDPNIRDFVNDRFKQIDEVNEATFKLLGDTALAIRDNPSLSVESNSNLDTLGDSHTLGNSSSLGNYSAALEQDIQAYNALQARSDAIVAQERRHEAEAAARVAQERRHEAEAATRQAREAAAAQQARMPRQRASETESAPKQRFFE